MKITRREFLWLGGGLTASLYVRGLAHGASGNYPVLLYHDISDDYRDAYTVSPSLFSAQMEWLFNNGFRAIALRDIDRIPENGKAVVITFDDGYATYMDYAFPLFREYGFHSTINVIGAYVGKYLKEGGNRPMLAWDEYRHLLRSGRVDVGCHTHDLHAAAHRGVLGVSDRTLEEDLERYRTVLRRETGISTDILAWPYGLYDAKRISIAKKAGFRYLLTSREDSTAKSADGSEIPRRNIDNQYDITSFRASVEP
jgi:peptidoglycan/xylan/chitin deacetylase (PgdA/CDA1 family)